jgi:hypothetical protein
VCCWIDWLLMIKNCLIESGPLCIICSSTGSMEGNYAIIASHELKFYHTSEVMLDGFEK